jgi:drug/metabolite transporter (DMT)-like permease
LVCAAATLALADRVRRRPLHELYRAPAPVIVLGMVGIFGYHVFLFEALDRAPIVQANLLNYLWPLLLVLLAPLARERPSALALLGAVIGFGGAALVVTGGRAVRFPRAEVGGFALAAGAAFVWALFSVLLARFPAARGRMPLHVAWSALGALAYAAARGQLAPPTGRALWAAAWLGVGPMALAFLCWDRAMALGRASQIGALSYLDPLLSTLAVAAFLGRKLTGPIWLGMTLIIAGAALPSVLKTRRAPD